MPPHLARHCVWEVSGRSGPFADPGPAPNMGGHPLDADRGGDEGDRAALEGRVRFSAGLVVAHSVPGGTSEPP